MKKFSSFALLLFCIYTANAQTGLPFQGIVRDTSSNLITNTNISLRLSSLDSTSGSPDYQETQSVTTNNLGLFTLNIGSDTVVTGTFAGINWATPKFVELEVDPTGGTSYIFMGTSQLGSVPYAMYALNSASGSGGPQPNKQILYGTGLTSDNGFTRDPNTYKTIINDNVGTQGTTQIKVDTAKISINYYDNASTNSAGFFAGPPFPIGPSTLFAWQALYTTSITKSNTDTMPWLTAHR